jgi:serine/threonine protein kinase
VHDRASATAALSAAQLQLMDEACDRFEAALRLGARPAVDDFLLGFSESTCALLARELRALQRAYDASAPMSAGDTKAPPGAAATHPVIALDAPALPRFGEYELLDKLGQGGMGEVFRARQLSANRIVVLKIIRRDRLEDLPADRRRQWVERFQLEARTAAQMEHENIVPVYQVGEVDGQHYYAMRFIAGRCLADVLQDGPLPPARAAAYLEQLARAIHHAHGRGILHRDLKPRNIIIDEHDRPFITDFGLAKWLLGESVELTALGALVGSPPYMAPEQIVDPSAVTAAADVYSLGATLYHALTGRAPFLASTVHETLRQAQLDEPVPPARLAPGLSRDLETVCLKCLRKDPRRRYASALDLADDLHRFLRGEPVQARRPSAPERALLWIKRHPAAAGLYLVLALFVAGILAAGWHINQANIDLEEANGSLERVNSNLKQANINLETSNDDLTKRKALALEAVASAKKMLQREQADHLSKERRALIANALAVYEKLHDATKAEHAGIHEQAQHHRLVGRIREMLGALARASAAYQAAIDLIDGRDNPAGAAASTRRALAGDYHRLGVIAWKRGRDAEAERALGQAVELRRELTDDDRHARFDLGASKYALAVVWSGMPGRAAQAREACREARIIQTELLKKTPDNADYAWALALTLYQQGVLACATGRPSALPPDFEHARTLLRDLIQYFPDEPVYQLYWCRIQMHWAAALATQNRLPDAYGTYEAAVKLLAILDFEHPGVPEFRLELAAAHASLAALLDRLADDHALAKIAPPTDAANHYRRAQTIAERLSDGSTEEVAYARLLAHVRFLLGVSLTRLGDWPTAETDLRLAIAEQEKLVVLNPGHPADADALGNSFNALARLQITRSQHRHGLSDWLLNITSRNPWQAGRVLATHAAFLREARSCAEQAVRVQQKLLHEHPEDAACRMHLRDDWATLAEAMILLGDHAGAARSAEHLPALMTDKKARALESAYAGEILALCVRLVNTDPALDGAARTREAEVYARRAIALFRAAIAGGWSDLERLRRSPAFEILHQRQEFRDLLATQK